MKHILVILIGFSGVVSPAISQDVAYSTATAQVKRFAAATCGNARHRTKPQLEVVSTVPELKKYAEVTFAEIASEAKLDKEGEVKFFVFIGPQKEMMKKISASIPMNAFRFNGSDGYGDWWRKDRDGVILSPVVVYLFTDVIGKGKPPDIMLASKNFLLKKTLHSFGFVGTSPEFDDSCFSSKNQALRETLSPLDKMLISFAYQYVPPGTLENQIWTLATTHWKKK